MIVKNDQRRILYRMNPDTENDPEKKLQSSLIELN